nr:methylmalonyl-CoA mutase [Geodermatophilaceae bacterium]
NSFDEAIALPTAKAARLALRTQQVLAHETDITATVDPFAGSYVVESMTDEVESLSRGLMDQVEEMGGAVEAIERGFQKAEIERSAYDVTVSIEDGSRVVVGQNRFTVEHDERYEPLRVDPAIEANQSKQLSELRERRSNDDVRRGLDGIRRAAEGTDNVLPPLKEALAARATVGEVSDAMREIWGSYSPTESL